MAMEGQISESDEPQPWLLYVPGKSSYPRYVDGVQLKKWSAAEMGSVEGVWSASTFEELPGCTFQPVPEVVGVEQSTALEAVNEWTLQDGNVQVSEVEWSRVTTALKERR